MMDARAFREMVFRVLAGIVGNDRKALGAFGPDLMRKLRNSKTAFGRLPAGHGDRVVIEYLVGNVDAGSGRGAQRQQPGMGVGAVAEILEDMVFVGERRLADPVGAFAAHLRDRLGGRGWLIKGRAVSGDAGVRSAGMRQ